MTSEQRCYLNKVLTYPKHELLAKHCIFTIKHLSPKFKLTPEEKIELDFMNIVNNIDTIGILKILDLNFVEKYKISHTMIRERNRIIGELYAKPNDTYFDL